MQTSFLKVGYPSYQVHIKNDIPNKFFGTLNCLISKIKYKLKGNGRWPKFWSKGLLKTYSIELGMPYDYFFLNFCHLCSTNLTFWEKISKNSSPFWNKFCCNSTAFDWIVNHSLISEWYLLSNTVPSLFQIMPTGI